MQIKSKLNSDCCWRICRFMSVAGVFLQVWAVTHGHITFTSLSPRCLIASIDDLLCMRLRGNMRGWLGDSTWGLLSLRLSLIDPETTLSSFWGKFVRNITKESFSNRFWVMDFRDFTGRSLLCVLYMYLCLSSRLSFQSWESKDCLLRDVKLYLTYANVYKIKRNAALLIKNSKWNIRVLWYLCFIWVGVFFFFLPILFKFYRSLTVLSQKHTNLVISMCIKQSHCTHSENRN